jgi:hypothetical protein
VHMNDRIDADTLCRLVDLRVNHVYSLYVCVRKRSG